jgi:hypothetical protein
MGDGSRAEAIRSIMGIMLPNFFLLCYTLSVNRGHAMTAKGAFFGNIIK